MATEYRITINNSEAAANGDVHLDVDIEESDDSGVTWQKTVNGHRTLVLSAVALLSILDGAGKTGQKRLAVFDLILAEVRSWGIVSADDAHKKLMAIVPGNDWPERLAITL